MIYGIARRYGARHPFEVVCDGWGIGAFYATEEEAQRHADAKNRDALDCFHDAVAQCRTCAGTGEIGCYAARTLATCPTCGLLRDVIKQLEAICRTPQVPGLSELSTAQRAEGIHA